MHPKTNSSRSSSFRPGGSSSSARSRHTPFSSASRGSFGGSRGGSRGGGNRRVSRGHYIDPNKFINKVIVTEEIERFVP